jgi:hypothetical protein
MFCRKLLNVHAGDANQDNVRERIRKEQRYIAIF